MGRHRRSAAGRAATGRATGITETHGPATDSHDPHGSYRGRPATMGIAPYLNPEAYADTNARSSAYLYATDDEYGPVSDTISFSADGFATQSFYAENFATDGYATDGYADGFAPAGGAERSRGRRRKKKAVTPVRTGLLGVSAAVAIGTVAVATGVVPGLDNYRLGGGTSASGGDNVQAAGVPSNSASGQGGTSGSAEAGRDSGGGTTSRDSDRSVSPTASASAPTAPAPVTTPSKKPKQTAPPGQMKPKPKHPAATKAPKHPSAPAKVSAQAAAEAEVLKLVNDERAKVGCSPASANSSLTRLAESFSEDMASRDFFDHTDPDGATPWDRAAEAGIIDLGGENIARGQADAAAVMEAWMNSPGHRANILNCDFKTLGVGVHFAAGGPWWTQDFGY
ncbi:CAP domain-containing protein [Streptomyces brasiliensis]|uniref:Membrane protein n=1 Tax=Streptomyces brasiliensis TaxID=1954 RepID=A0A917P206_9ACTN|nr:CAP domain-containing protein [Streptomyces brasiliensis]GGJ54057.1 membrane protein [Streptomyces brasiliensis]